MITFLLITGIVMLGLGLVSYASSKRAAHTNSDAAALSLLPGDIKYESPNGRLSAGGAGKEVGGSGAARATF